jgi:hypothetical protein
VGGTSTPPCISAASSLATSGRLGLNRRPSAADDGGEIVRGLKKQPTLMDISAKLFDVGESLTQKTHGPLKVAVAA